MKLILFFVVACLALHNGKGAPRKAVYKFVRCNPEGDQANCVTQQSPEMAWSPDLPAKLPASTALYLEAEPVEDESPLGEEDELNYEEDEEEDEDEMKDEVDEEEEEGEMKEEEEDEDEMKEEEEIKEEEEDEMEEGEEETPMMGEEGESPVEVIGSGDYEGSAAESTFMADRAFLTAESETGSGESWTEEDKELHKGGDRRGMRRLFPSMSLAAEAKPVEQELREDHLLQI